MAIDKIDELEQLPLSMLPDDWPLPVKLAWQDNTNTTNITSETVNLSLTEAEKVQQTQASQGTQLAQLSQSVTQQGQDVATAKQEAQTALTAANSIASKADKAEQDAASALIEATAAKQSAKTNETGIGSNLTAIQQLQIAIKNLPSDTKLENEIQANASSITKLQDAINNLPSDTKLENEIQANASALEKLKEEIEKKVLGFPGSDYIVENNIYEKGFCRVYASGWCEQGGTVLGNNMTGTYPYGAEYSFYRPFTTHEGLVIVGVNANATSSIRSDVSLSASSNQELNRFRVYLRNYAGQRVDGQKTGTYWYAVGQTAVPPKPPGTAYTPTEIENSITTLQGAVTQLQNASVSVDLATLAKAGIVKQARWVDNPPRRAPRISSMDVPLLSSYLNMLVDFVVDLDKNLRDAGIVGQKPPKGGKG